MNQIQLWQLIVDIGLITSVLTLTTRALKTSRLPGMLPKTRELELSLRSLIGEAEAAGLQLNDQLLRREQNIQKALSEIQQSEARIVKAIADADELQNKLQVTRTETVRVIQDLKAGFERGVQTERTRQESRPSSVATAPQQEVVRSQTSHPQTLQAFEQGVSDNFVEQTYPRTPLQQSVEVSTPTQTRQASGASIPAQAGGAGAPASAADLKRVYQSAELLIKEGNAVESVASQMKLPVEGVKLLAQMIEIEREEDSRKQDSTGKFATADSRLGALGNIRRQNSIL